MLFVDADDVLHSLTLEVLHTARLEELIVACEPVEDILIAVLGADEKHILSQIVRLLQRLELVLVAEDFEHLHVLGLHCSKERELSLEVRLQALLWAHLKQPAHEIVLTGPRGHVHGSIALKSISAREDVQVREHLRVEQVVYYRSLIFLHGCEEASLSFSIASFQGIIDLLGHLVVLTHVSLQDLLQSFQIARFDRSVLYRLLCLVAKVGELLSALLKESRDLSLEIRLATKSNLLAFVSTDERECSLALLVASEAQAKSDHHLADKVILSVLNHTESHDVQESVAIGVRHHRVGSRLANQLFKALSVELGGGDVDRRLAVDVTDKGAGLTVLQEGVDHEGVASQDSLIQGQF